jgi:hypothetical protein
MIDALEDLIKTFPGDPNRVRCFNHVTSLVARSTIRMFDIPKAQADAALDEAERELQELAEGIDLEDLVMQGEHNEADYDDDDAVAVDDEDLDGWVDERAGLSTADRQALDKSLQPVRLVLVKVSICSFQDKVPLTVR